MLFPQTIEVETVYSRPKLLSHRLHILDWLFKYNTRDLLKYFLFGITNGLGDILCSADSWCSVEDKWYPATQGDNGERKWIWRNCRDNHFRNGAICCNFVFLFPLKTQCCYCFFVLWAYPLITSMMFFSWEMRCTDIVTWCVVDPKLAILSSKLPWC